MSTAKRKLWVLISNTALVLLYVYGIHSELAFYILLTSMARFLFRLAALWLRFWKRRRGVSSQPCSSSGAQRPNTGEDGQRSL